VSTFGVHATKEEEDVHKSPSSTRIVQVLSFVSLYGVCCVQSRSQYVNTVRVLLTDVGGRAAVVAWSVVWRSVDGCWPADVTAA